MIVVSDTSPLNYLVLIDAIDVLPQLFGEVHVPPTVMQELQHPRTPEPVKRWAQSPPDWLLIQSPSADTPLDPRLDPGEAEAIALALELHATAILVDESHSGGTRNVGHDYGVGIGRRATATRSTDRFRHAATHFVPYYRDTHQRRPPAERCTKARRAGGIGRGAVSEKYRAFPAASFFSPVSVQD